jgi:hypothetical protein
MTAPTALDHRDGRLDLARLAAVAFAAMCAQDLLSTVMVVFESHYQAIPAGIFDVAAWITWLASSAMAIDEVLKGGWRSKRARVVIAAVSAANFAGTVAGVYLAGMLS